MIILPKKSTESRQKALYYSSDQKYAKKYMIDFIWYAELRNMQRKTQLLPKSCLDHPRISFIDAERSLSIDKHWLTLIKIEKHREIIINCISFERQEFNQKPEVVCLFVFRLRQRQSANFFLSERIDAARGNKRRRRSWTLYFFRMEMEGTRSSWLTCGECAWPRVTWPKGACRHSELRLCSKFSGYHLHVRAWLRNGRQMSRVLIVHPRSSRLWHVALWHDKWPQLRNL